MKVNYKVFEMPDVKEFVISSPGEVFENYKDYAKADREMFFILHLNPRHQVIDSETHAVGTVDSTSIYPREVIKSILLKSTSSIVLVHNHPSGEPAPSSQDNELTRQLVYACAIMGIKILDHVIVGRKGFYSYADEGKIEDYLQKFEDLEID